MVDRYIEIEMTNAHAERLVSEDLSPDFVEKFIVGEKYTWIRFGPFVLHRDELKKLNQALEFLDGLNPRNVKVTSKPY